MLHTLREKNAHLIFFSLQQCFFFVELVVYLQHKLSKLKLFHLWSFAFIHIHMYVRILRIFCKTSAHIIEISIAKLRADLVFAFLNLYYV